MCGAGVDWSLPEIVVAVSQTVGLGVFSEVVGKFHSWSRVGTLYCPIQSWHSSILYQVATRCTQVSHHSANQRPTNQRHDYTVHCCVRTNKKMYAECFAYCVPCLCGDQLSTTQCSAKAVETFGPMHIPIATKGLHKNDSFSPQLLPLRPLRRGCLHLEPTSTEASPP